MRLFLMFFTVLGIVVADPDTVGCSGKGANKFSNLKYKNSISLIFCSSFNSVSCGDTPKLVRDDDGFFDIKTRYPCKYFYGETSNEDKSVIAFISQVETPSKKVYYYPQITDKNGLFLTKTFKTIISKSGVSALGDLKGLVKAVVPKNPHKSDINAVVTTTCFKDDTKIEESIENKEGKVYCKFETNCSPLKRDKCSKLVVRTTVADFGDADGSDIVVKNDFIFLKKGESSSKDVKCEKDNNDDKIEWYLNGSKKGKTGEFYDINNHDGTDTIIQCYVMSAADVAIATTIWNIFTVSDVNVQPAVTETEENVTHNKSKTFDCTVPNLDLSGIFPSPLGIWNWLADKADKEEEKKVTVVDPPNFSYTKTMDYSDYGNFKCYLFNGVEENLLAHNLAKNYKTAYIVETKVESLIPEVKYWYEYNVLTTVPEAYFVKKDDVILNCSITKEAKYDIWWKLENEYFHLEVKEDDSKVLQKLNPGAEVSAKLADAMITENRDGWTITQHDKSKLALETRQDFILKQYKSDMTDTETTVAVICFLADTTAITTVSQLKGIPDASASENQEVVKKLNIRIFDHVTKPVVKGPLNQIQSEKEAKDMILNCKTYALPPAFIYFEFGNNKTEDPFNITKELLKQPKAVQFTRYRSERKTDNLTTLTIQKPNEDDEGKFTCYAINRDTKENDPVAGPDADVFIEERCSEGAQFCFKNGATLKMTFLWMLAVPILSCWTSSPLSL